MQAVFLKAQEQFADEKFQKVNIFDSPRMFCDIYCFEPGQEQTLHSHEDNEKIYYVLEGNGHSVMDGVRFDWGAGDFFMVPPWVCHEHANRGAGDALFFVIGDKPILDAFRMYREEKLEDGDGHQPVTAIFEPLTLG